ncbi:DUF305 domain-containing protein [Chelativorans sp.]|uniref:DUF305 domain-containing protein n=1 Tax=Chelativorans sp. TaxID=2203393 RepID=UPI002810F584|nr:DUF305 domain-containing protein [Chelativorans sp.]
MKKSNVLSALVIIMGGFAFPAAGQDSHNHGGISAPAAAELPAICKAAAPPSGGHGGHGAPAASADNLDAGHKALLDSMSVMEAMGPAMMVPDIDVAFVCGMIPHHQGAIAMARAELEHGDDEWAKAMAEKVIAAQEQEIAEMIEWLEKQEDAR